MINCTKKVTLLGIFQEFCLKFSEGLFYKSSACIFMVVHGLFKIIQIYVNNKINNQKLLVS